MERLLPRLQCRIHGGGDGSIAPPPPQTVYRQQLQLPDNFWTSNHTKVNSSRGFDPDPIGRAYSAPHTPSWWGRG